jgi:Caspase domain/Domain of unknown function (DUF4384)
MMRGVANRLAATLVLLSCVLTGPCVHAASEVGTPLPPLKGQWALLIGIGQYQDKRIPALAGPAHDVAAMREVLQARWDFPEQHIRTLQDRQATRKGILQALKALLEQSAAGDDILIYYAGHGTSQHDSARHLPMPHDTGALVPWDYPYDSKDPAHLIIGRSDLRPLLLQMEERGRKVWLVADACYSGQLVRNTGDDRDPEALPPRLITLEPGNTARRTAQENASASATPITPWPYRKVQMLAAASAGTRAVEIPHDQLRRTPTRDGKPHGAFTDALLRILHGELPADFNADGVLSLDEVHRASAEFMDNRPYNHSAQRLPLVFEDEQALGQSAVLRARNVAAKATGGAAPVLRLRIDSSQPLLTQALAGVPHVQVVAAGKAAELVLTQNGPYWLLKSEHGGLLGQIDSKLPDASQRLRGQLVQQAWVAYIGGLARQYRKGGVPVELGPPGNSGRVAIGSPVHFVLRPAQDAVLVVLDVDANGKISVPFPKTGAQMALRKGGTRLKVPDASENDSFTVGEPIGLDVQLHFAFDVQPKGLDALRGQEGLDAEDERVRIFVNGLAKLRGRFGFAQTVLRVEP